jgi:hypothetical protein
MSSLSIRPTVPVWRSDSQCAEHAAGLLAMFARVVDHLKHDDPGIHVEPVCGLEPGTHRSLFASCQCQQPFPADAHGLPQLDKRSRGATVPFFHWQRQGSQVTVL